MRLILIFLCVLIGGCAWHDQLHVEFANRLYRVKDFLGAEDIRLTDGKYEAWSRIVFYDYRYALGDLNADGLQDAVVILIQNNGGNQSWYGIGFLMNNGTQLTHQATIDLDDRADIQKLYIKNQKVCVQMNIHQPGDSSANPSKEVHECYRYPGAGVFTHRGELMSRVKNWDFYSPIDCPIL